MRQQALSSTLKTQINQHRANDMTIQQIAIMYGLSTSTVGRYCTVRTYQERGDKLKLRDQDLTDIEAKQNTIIVQSDINRYAYSINKISNTLTLIDRKTGKQVDIKAREIYKYGEIADELIEVAELYMGQTGLHKVS